MSQLAFEQETYSKPVPAVVTGVVGSEFPRYLVVSAVALAVDISLLYILATVFGAHYLIANPIAFAVGAFVAYVGSVHWAFAKRKMSNKGFELLIFVAIGVCGLAVNEGMMWLGIEVAALSLLVAKIGAAVTSFGFNFVVRKLVLFSA